MLILVKAKISLRETIQILVWDVNVSISTTWSESQHFSKQGKGLEQTLYGDALKPHTFNESTVPQLTGSRKGKGRFSAENRQQHTGQQAGQRLEIYNNT